MKKSIKITLIITIPLIIIILIIFAGFLIINKINSNERATNLDKENKNQETLYALDTKKIENPCNKVIDNYELPDFNIVKTKIPNEDLVKDLPKSGELTIKFYHYTENCKFIDKSFLITKGKITESNSNSDILIEIPSSFVNKINTETLCSIIQNGINTGEIKTSSQLSETKLLWKYKSMLKYRECLGM